MKNYNPLNETQRKELQVAVGAKPDGIIGINTMGAIYEKVVGPIVEPNGNYFCGIYDFNRQSDPNWKIMWDNGIRAVIHKVSEGDTSWKEIYQQRRAEAKAKGFLWGGYHFSHGGNPISQANKFINAAQFTDDELIALDWEEGGNYNMTLSEAERFCAQIHVRTGRWPVVYGGGLLRDKIQNANSDILSLCPLWYVQVQAHITPTQIPAQVWPQGCVLHQYWSDDTNIGAIWPADMPCNDDGCDGADRSRFFGTETQLRAVWPFRTS